MGIYRIKLWILDASAITDISGDYTDIVDLYNSGVTGLGDEAITITDELKITRGKYS